MTDEEFDDRVRSAISAAIRYVDDTQSPNWTGAVESALGSIRKSVELLRSAPTGETEPPIGYVVVSRGGALGGIDAIFTEMSHCDPWLTREVAQKEADRLALTRFGYTYTVEPIGASAGGQDTALQEVEAIGRALLVDWAEHLTPAAPGSVDDKPCPWDKLSEGSREQYLQRAFKILTALREVTSGASAGSGEPRFTKEDVEAVRTAIGATHAACQEFCVGSCACSDESDKLDDLANRLAPPGPRVTFNRGP